MVVITDISTVTKKIDYSYWSRLGHLYTSLTGKILKLNVCDLER